MPRKFRIRSQVLPYHVFNRVNNRDWFPLPIERVWEIFAQEWSYVSALMGAQSNTSLLMSNHFHQIVTTPEVDLSEVMQQFSRSVTRAINSETGRSGHLFTGRYKACLIDNPAYYSHALKYVLRNPVKAGVVDRVEDYVFSTLHGQLGLSHLPFPVFRPAHEVDDGLIPSNVQDYLKWLNTPFANEDEEVVRKALLKSRFKLPLTQNQRKRTALEEGLA